MTEVREYTNVDKSGWGDGPWQDEPDKIHWIDEATDLDVLMVRGPAGAWCGYVGVTEGHPAFDVDYDSVKPADGEYIDVHGSLTFSAFCSESEDPAEGICHVPFEGRPHRVYWLGFDCAHAGDLVPKLRGYMTRSSSPLAEYMADDVYRDRAYVENEVRHLASQLKAMA